MQEGTIYRPEVLDLDWANNNLTICSISQNIYNVNIDITNSATDITNSATISFSLIDVLYFGLAFCAVTVALFLRDGGPKSPCKWPSQSEMNNFRAAQVQLSYPEAQNVNIVLASEMD